MYHIPDALYEEKMPRRAKQLFVDTFSKHHKLNAGDEDLAMQKARNALEERYVRVNDLQWIPRRAAYEIIRDDMSDDSDGVQRQQVDVSSLQKHKRKNTHASSTSSDSEASSAYETDDKLVSTGKTVRTKASRKKRVKGKILNNNHYNNKSQPHYSSVESHSDEDDY
uniref:ChaB-like protein n=1 Tax=Anticarsia gemmatalis multiple nucleopolyhedrovirus TaxID=268591 RepID=A0A0S3IZT3_9ABAC|nr:hypothetical protein AGNV_103 [Anticarsia gemmatalis multiple nucleopolyhedrovirus]ALR71323.1 hypothetical protein AGNV_103 [Anticarsia gemmatalis multiple nucleopolyhedrovirus]ALR71481.1 hypothetical protein AGNV_103 [Anticarsia gemmatalis multiple nucleopolyhedrovirus]ALR71950.1 hypothetical protein AGNV_103 [Anticarsia gemmatalis multiple nucleopolyhedrovirus]AXE72279.1 hypothetical protein [Anticarsia gemmatalis multiple nucleopolyhedrovirus]